MSPKLFGRGRKDSKGYAQIRPSSRQSTPDGKMGRKSGETTWSTRWEKRPAELQRSKTTQSEATATSGSSRRTPSSLSGSDHHAWAFPFGLRRSQPGGSDIFEKSQQAALKEEQARKKDAKATRKREEKKQKDEKKHEWTEHLGWLYGANMPGYWVI